LQSEKLLLLMSIHMSILEPPARRRFGDALLGMIGPDPADN